MQICTLAWARKLHKLTACQTPPHDVFSVLLWEKSLELRFICLTNSMIALVGAHKGVEDACITFYAAIWWRGLGHNDLFSPHKKWSPLIFVLAKCLWYIPTQEFDNQTCTNIVLWLPKSKKWMIFIGVTCEKVFALFNKNEYKIDSIGTKDGNIRWLWVKRSKAAILPGVKLSGMWKEREGWCWITDEKQRLTRDHCQPVKELGPPAGARLQGATLHARPSCLFGLSPWCLFYPISCQDSGSGVYTYVHVMLIGCVR